jgi:hypothetical protein
MPCGHGGNRSPSGGGHLALFSPPDNWEGIEEFVSLKEGFGVEICRHRRGTTGSSFTDMYSVRKVSMIYYVSCTSSAILLET